MAIPQEQSAADRRTDASGPKFKAWQSIGAAAALFIAVIWVFLPAMNNGYVNYDDPDYLITNQQVQGGLNWDNVKWAFTTTSMSNWHPLTWLSHMADCQVFGFKLWGHHLTSVLLHGFNSVLVFLLLRVSTGSFWRSLLVAACFGLHPLRVESVAWLAERKDVLSGCFGLAALLAYVHYAKRKAAAPPTATPPARQAWPPYLLALILFALSLLSKPMMVTLPCVMLLLDFWPLQRVTRSNGARLLGEKIPFFGLSAALCIITYMVQRSGGAMEQMAHYSMAHHIQNALVSYLRYLGKFFWPDQLAPIYPVVEHWPIWVVGGAALTMAAITALTLWLRTSAAYLLVGWLWFLGTLVPVIGLVAVGEQAMADRYTYFAELGIALMVIWAGADFTRRWKARTPVAWLLCVTLLLAGSVTTRKQIRVWSNSETLFRHTVNVTTNNYSAHANLSAALLEQNRAEEALLHAREAARLRPDSPETWNNLGATLGRLGRPAEAIAAFRSALNLPDKRADVHRNLAIALSQIGKADEALKHYQTATEIEPKQATLRLEYGIALSKAGRLDEAIQECETATQLDPDFAAAHEKLAEVLNQQGRFGEAALHRQKAAQLNPAAGRQ